MKFKTLIASACCMVLIALSSHTMAQVKKKPVAKKKVAAVANTTQAAVAVKPPPPPFATAQEIEDGKALVAKSDCLACHKTEVKLVGPAYLAVAGKYPQNQSTVDQLSQKIIAGGKDVWGPVPMIPHPAIALADANKMIKYILTLSSQNATMSSK